jgi:hypothetical protein
MQATRASHLRTQHFARLSALAVFLELAACGDHEPDGPASKDELSVTNGGSADASDAGSDDGGHSAPDSDAQASTPGFDSLRARIGDHEKVNLEVYFVGFPSELENGLRESVARRLGKVQIVDAKPWWIPNDPLFGAKDFATRPAPPGLPPDIVPPDGLIRYEPNSMEKNIFGQWVPKKDLPDIYDDWHANANVMYYAEHEGSLRDVPWKVNDLYFHFLPPETLETLYTALEKDRTKLDSEQPPASFELYSFNELFDWLAQNGAITPPRGGAAVVFMNFDRFQGSQYSFYADPKRDLVDMTGYAPIEVQHPPAQPSSPAGVETSAIMNKVLGGKGLTQAKMRAAIEVVCAETTTAAKSNIDLPGARPEQSLCARWELRPIRNMQGNSGRQYYVSDATDLLADYASGASDRNKLLDGIDASLFELYRYGILNTSTKGNVFSERYELRTAVLDLRYTARELCAARQLDIVPDIVVAGLCATAEGEGEDTYQRSDVFDAELAKRSLAEFAPGEWEVNFVDVPFDANFVASARAKKAIRTILPAQPIAEHDPLYRDLSIPVGDQHVNITSSWETGPDFIITQLSNILGPQYDKLWPGPQPVFARPYHETGKPLMIPHLLILTPPPDGPLGEKWGPAPVDFQLFTTIGIYTTFGGGGFWASVSGNELGGFYRRDFLLALPQYFLGPRRGAGDNPLYWVMPDGEVQISPLPIAARAIDLGAPHWCNEFNSPDTTKRAVCRDFVRKTTTLQSIETIQHGLGYMHAPEPRVRYHYDGQLSTMAREQELNATPLDRVGRVLHRMVNQYTTLGLSTVWGQDVNEWNGVGLASGMQATMFRSHAREMIQAVEKLAQQATESAGASFAGQGAIAASIDAAAAEHAAAVNRYVDWEYRESIAAATRALSRLDEAFTAMGEPDRIH